MSQTDPSHHSWHFINPDGSFRLSNAHRTSYLYFPLVNEAGLMSAVTPTLNGDIKTSQNTFLTLPVSVEDLHNSRAGRNFWVEIDGFGPWSASGNSAAQQAKAFTVQDEAMTLEAGFLWHKVTRQHPQAGLLAEITSFVPASGDTLEVMRVVLTNLGQQPVALTPTAAIPLFGRSADNLRDHRHVTSLLHRITCEKFGVSVRPALSFDERGHLPNAVTYGLLGCEADGSPPVGFFPVLEDFIGEGGSLDSPQAVICGQPPTHLAGEAVDGYEAMGGLRFEPLRLEPGTSQTYILLLAIGEQAWRPEEWVRKFGSAASCEAALQAASQAWESKLASLQVSSASEHYDRWVKWVTLQPILRRMFGNSFLPYHDYGRGGRGWRDLWQDILALLIMEDGGGAAIGETLWSYFAGVRMDGSNATIIGSGPDEFKADRNNIPRVWMDHGAWPLLTARLYIDRTGDLDFLLREQTYFKDHLSHRCQGVDRAWQPEHGTLLRTASAQPYTGSIFEHLLVQHLAAFFNVGEHNLIRLEGADWNDGMDMARQRGESAAFSALYAGNLAQLAELALQLEASGAAAIDLAAELVPLCDTLSELIDYDSIEAKRSLFQRYLESCAHTVAGEKITVPLPDLSRDLQAKAGWLSGHLRRQEWITNSQGYGWFNGYYDDDGKRLEGDHPGGVRMTLTGQVFNLMAGVATPEQARQIIRSADRYLYDAQVGGYRLNTNFGATLLNMGRSFGFAFGHKENGAMFSHMAVMFANALYGRGFVREGFRVLDDLYRHCTNFSASRMYPGLPEYISARGRGMYPYLTGSASWYLLTLVSEVFGVRGSLGDLLLSPKLVREQFGGSGLVALRTRFAGKSLTIRYRNPQMLDYGEYQIGQVALNGKPVRSAHQAGGVLLPRQWLLDASGPELVIDITFSPRLEE